MDKEKMFLFFARHKKRIIFGVILFFASSLSFAAGYKVNRDFNPAPIIIEKCSQVGALVPGVLPSPSSSADVP